MCVCPIYALHYTEEQGVGGKTKLDNITYTYYYYYSCIIKLHSF